MSALGAKHCRFDKSFRVREKRERKKPSVKDCRKPCVIGRSGCVKRVKRRKTRREREGKNFLSAPFPPPREKNSSVKKTTSG